MIPTICDVTAYLHDHLAQQPDPRLLIDDYIAHFRMDALIAGLTLAEHPAAYTPAEIRILLHFRIADLQARYQQLRLHHDSQGTITIQIGHQLATFALADLVQVCTPIVGGVA